MSSSKDDKDMSDDDFHDKDTITDMDSMLTKSPVGRSSFSKSSTPLRNNYAAPHTPIASVKRPRSSLLSPGSNATTASGKSSLPTSPLIPSSSDGAAANATTSTTCTTPMTPGANTRDSMGTMSPMHPPRPLVIREDEPANFNINLLDDDEKERGGDGTSAGSGSGGDPDSSTWVGRQVDALFSPVLNFLSGDKEDEDDHGHPHPNLQRRTHKDDAIHSNESHAEEYKPKKQNDDKTTEEDEFAAVTDEDVTMEDAVSKQLQPSDTSQTTQATSHDDEEEDTSHGGGGHHHPDHHQEGEDPNHSNSSDHHHQEDEDHLVGDDDASSHGSLEEDEFNPYVFIKSLPAYDLVAPLRPPIALPPKKEDSPPISLVLDLDETLVHCTVEPVDDADLIFPVVFHGMTYQVHVRLRPHLFTFLEKIKGKFEIIVFTASQKVYANELLNLIDPDGKYIQYRMFRESCLAVEGNFLKDLNVLGRDLSRSVLVDNSPHAFGYQMDNGIPIESWFDDPHDTELLKLERFLRTLHTAPDVRPVVRRKFETYRLVAES